MLGCAAKVILLIMIKTENVLKTAVDTLQAHVMSTVGLGDELYQLPKLWRQGIFDEYREELENYFKDGFTLPPDHYSEAISMTALNFLTRDCFTREYFQGSEFRAEFRNMLVYKLARDLSDHRY